MVNDTMWLNLKHNKMYCLSDTQIDYIFNDISARGVEMESLQQNLLDHVCCIIEQNLEANGDFESFYQKTIKTFYKDALWEIEEETLLLLTFKNYYTMKKIMIISGTVSAAAMILGILFKFMHWPGAALGIFLGILISSFIFLPLLFTLKVKEKQTVKDKLILGLAIVSGILISLAVLFKIFRWPGANMLGLSFVMIMLVLYIPLYFFTGIKNPDSKINTVVTTIIMIMGCGLFLTLVNTTPRARPLDNTEIEYLSNDETMIKEEADKLYKIAESDTSLNNFIIRLKAINKSVNELKSNLLEYEIGHKAITKDLKNKGINFTVGTFLGFLDRNKEEYENIRILNNLVTENSINSYIEKIRITKTEDTNKRISFSSSILNVVQDTYYYDNTILGAYKDLCEVQLNAIKEIKELIEIKKQRHLSK